MPTLDAILDRWTAESFTIAWQRLDCVAVVTVRAGENESVIYSDVPYLPRCWWRSVN